MKVEQLERLLKKIKYIQSIMVDVSTGESLLQEKEDEYIVVYLDIETEIKSLTKAGLALHHKNSFRTLWDWYGYYSSKLPSYDSRREYVQQLYAQLVGPIERALHRHRVYKTPLEDFIRDLAKRTGTRPEADAQEFRLRFEGLHPKIVQRCRVPFESGEFEGAIFGAMTVVEEELRARVSPDSLDAGVALISRSMDPQSPIVSFSNVKAEQEAAFSLYCGAIGSLKSAIGRRFLDFTDPVETFECLVLGSLLMRMVDRAA
jgi:uncharacterized protein (TIGR02391 family)